MNRRSFLALVPALLALPAVSVAASAPTFAHDPETTFRVMVELWRQQVKRIRDVPSCIWLRSDIYADYEASLVAEQRFVSRDGSLCFKGVLVRDAHGSMSGLCTICFDGGGWKNGRYSGRYDLWERGYRDLASRAQEVLA